MNDSIESVILSHYTGVLCATAGYLPAGITTRVLASRPVTSVLPTVALPRVIGRLIGRAVPMGSPCSIFERSETGDPYCEMEQFDLRAFDAVSPAAVTVRAGHEGADLAGRMAKLGVDAMALAFRFDVHDTAHGRQVYQDVADRKLSRCSIAFSRSRSVAHYVGQTCHYDVVSLSHIAIVARGAWYGTECWAVPV